MSGRGDAGGGGAGRGAAPIPQGEAMAGAAPVEAVVAEGLAPASTGGMRSEASPTPGVFPGPESMRPTLLGTRYVVVAGHPLAAHAAAEVLEAGGSAIDAGVAGGLALNVAQVDMCNLGGIAPIVLRRAGEAPVAISGVGAWGASATLDAVLERHGGDLPLGLGAAIVPAAWAAWTTALERFGTRSLAEVAAPAVALAEDGFALDPRTADAHDILGRTYAQWPTSAAIYRPHGRPPRAGEILRQPALARTLRRLVDAAGGGDRAAGIAAARDAFYRGAIGRRIAEWCAERGGWLTADDLARFAVTVEPAASAPYGDQAVFTPPGYTQGPVMLLALRILGGLDLPAGGAARLHLLAEALRLAFEERDRALADPAFAEAPLDALLSQSNAARLRARIDPARAMPDPRGPAPGRARPDTTHLCVVDAAGNAFSATPSDTLDGGPVIPDLGILVSPRGVQSSLTPGDPNAVAPGKRPRVTPAPAIAVAEDGRVTAFGCPGGDVIVQAQLQAFLNLVGGMTHQQAVEAPRMATFSFPSSFFPNPHFPMRLDVEARVPPEVREGLRAMGHDVRDWPEWEFDAGGVAMAGDVVPPGEGRVLAAGADPRRTAYAWGR